MDDLSDSLVKRTDGFGWLATYVIGLMGSAMKSRAFRCVTAGLIVASSIPTVSVYLARLLVDFFLGRGVVSSG